MEAQAPEAAETTGGGDYSGDSSSGDGDGEYPGVGEDYTDGDDGDYGRAGVWRRARTSWYGEPDWVEPFVGWICCKSPGVVQVAKEEAAAYSDDNPDYAGSCGRCYEVKCVDGPVVGSYDKPIPLEELYYYPKFADVLIIDACPCIYCPNGEDGCRYQESCCYKSIDHPKAEKKGGRREGLGRHKAFQQMAHPSYGLMMIDFRPVDCNTREAIQYIPGFINRKLYSEMVGEGWSWFASRETEREGLDGGAAACAQVPKGIGMVWWARGAGIPNFEPFAGVEAISFWIKNKVEPGQPLPVRVRPRN
ncbi:hypothetical protein DUNSADRAFT_17574 [Dunaliella salina]|uniref:Expansin-like EG45 domain-containing protein n=1 Tax=Dunaliella salina TaxID=3046 RepID=A0ABQ7G1J7_DUNSA|nr:hypothetical protein DUNSADRAFT_17574 [Dunaliella salina]|eukprot:KAF5828466.1 hypothetical protein DUNSADRAFT_17574 [Dunaliella salina]